MIEPAVVVQKIVISECALLPLSIGSMAHTLVCRYRWSSAKFPWAARKYQSMSVEGV